MRSRVEIRWLVLGLGMLGLGFPSAAHARPLLVLGLDGVSLDTAREAYHEGILDGFFPPSAVIAPFPSLTDLALMGYFNAGRTQGYEAIYFNLRQARLSGTTSSYLSASAEPEPNLAFYDSLHYSESRFWEIPYNLFPRLLLGMDVWRFRRSQVVRRFLNDADSLEPVPLARSHDGPVMLAYLEQADVMFHQLGRDGAMNYLRSLGETLRGLRARGREPFDIVLFSDHGNEEGIFAYCPIEQHLTAKGFRSGTRLGERRAFVLPTFGLIGSVAVHTLPEDAEGVAQALADLRGVDLVLYKEGSEIGVLHGSRAARILFRPSPPRYKYKSVSGDPLGYRPIVEDLQAAGTLDEDGFAGGETWFNATRDSMYPNALERAVEAMTTLVENPATVLVSLEPGYFYGRDDIRFWTRLLATHGGMRREQSMAFVMTTRRRLPSHLHYREVIPEVLRGEPQ